MNKSTSALHLIPQQGTFWTLLYTHATLRRLPVPSPSRSVSDLLLSDKYSFTSLTRDSDGLSVIVALSKDSIDQIDELDGLGKADKVHGPWKAIKIAGPLDFGLTGILNELSTPLRNAEIGIYAISTWDTDYVLVPQSKRDAALDILSEDGWTVLRP